MSQEDLPRAGPSRTAAFETPRYMFGGSLVFLVEANPSRL